MPLTGYIDGNAPPFILLAIILSSFAPAWSLAKEMSPLGSLRLRKAIRRFGILDIITGAIATFLVIWRIIQNGNQNLGKDPSTNQIVTFPVLDLAIIALLMLLLAWVVVLIIASYGKARQYPYLNRGGGI
jgi:hypothetical protein